MVVDIEKGDTFQACGNLLYQYRAQTMRYIQCGVAPTWETKVVAPNETPFPLELAVKRIEGMGHEVKHVAPTPSYPVVRVAELTHAATCCGALTAIGTLEQCLEYTDEDGFIVELDWTGVGGIDDATLKAALSVPIPPSPSPFPRKQPAPLASNDNYTLEDGRPAPFKVGDVVRGKVVEEMWMVKHDGPKPALYFGEHGARANIARNGSGTLTRVAVVEVSEGETK